MCRWHALVRVACSSMCVVCGIIICVICDMWRMLCHAACGHLGMCHVRVWSTMEDIFSFPPLTAQNFFLTARQKSSFSPIIQKFLLPHTSFTLLTHALCSHTLSENTLSENTLSHTLPRALTEDSYKRAHTLSHTHSLTRSHALSNALTHALKHAQNARSHTLFCNTLPCAL
jgi:hypothetical protein